MNSQTNEPPAEEIKLELVVPDEGIRHAITKDAPDFLEIILKRKKLLTKVENFDPVEDATDTPRMDDAKRIRLDLVKCRTGLETIRKKLGEEARRVVDGVNEMFRGYREENESAEEFLRESEEFGARYEASRKAELTAERSPQLVALGFDPSLYNLGEATEVQWQTILTGAKAAKEQADREAEERRKQEEADRQEKDRLKAELAETQRKADAAAADARAKQRKLEEKAEGDRKVANAKLAEERKQKEALEQKERDREAAEALKKKEEAAAKRRAERAPDKTKLTTYVDNIETALKSFSEFKSPEAKGVALYGLTEGSKLVAKLRKEIEAL